METTTEELRPHSKLIESIAKDTRKEKPQTTDNIQQNVIQSNTDQLQKEEKGNTRRI